VEFAAKRPQLFSSAKAFDVLGSPVPLVPIAIDPPDHTRFRRMLDPFFSPKKMAEREPELRRQAGELIDAIVAKGECDVVPELATPFPSQVFLTLFGLPMADRDRLVQWKDSILEFTDPSSADPASSVKHPVAGGPIGLGYSLYLRDSNGDPVRVDPSREFHYKDALRVSLEANTDGFLYVFYTENDGHPQMLFPDARLIQGTNRIEAHVPYEVPSSHEADPSRRWFVFDEKPALERLYIVITRQPLPMVPVGDDLLAYCNGQANCTWQPPESVWSTVRDGLNAKVQVSKSDSVGQAQTQTERDAAVRGIGLDTTAPAPTVVRMNVSSNAPALVTKVELVHK